VKTAILTLTLSLSLFGRGCIRDPHYPEKCENPSDIDSPEPATFLLMGAGLIGVGLILRRKNKI
jgi:hypothetical protein